MVVLGHGMSMYGALPFLHEPRVPWIQNIAVVVFFVLSGLLIPYATCLKISKSNQYGFTRFLIDRFSRIFSAFIPSIIFVAVIDAIAVYFIGSYSYERAFNFRTFAANILMLQDHPLWRVAVGAGIDPITSFGSARPFWTVGVEWWLYMAFGWLVLQKRTRPLRWTIGLILIVPVAIEHIVGGRGNGLTMVWLTGWACFRTLSGGALHLLPKPTATLAALASFALAVLRLRVSGSAYDLLFAVLFAAGLVLVISLLDGVPHAPRARTQSAIRFFGGYSLTLYLIHYSIMTAIQPLGKSLSPSTLLALSFVISNIAAAAIAHFTERNYRALAGLIAQQLEAPRRAATTSSP